LSYLWTPATGLSSPYVSNPYANPDVSTTYIVATSNSGGGCRTTDTVVVKASKIKSDMTLVGKDAYCLGYGDSSILHVQPTDRIQWYKNGAAISGATQTSLRVNQTGVYYAMLYNDEECIISTAKQPITIDKARPAEAYPVQYALINTPQTLKARGFGQEYLWSPGINLSTRGNSAPVFTGSQDRLYTIQIKTSTGCITVDTQLVKTIKQVEVFVPTGFTPNNDGKNDFLHPIMMGVKQLRYFRVFNRWGNLMYDMRAEQRGWDGSSQGIPQQTQTLVWMFEGVGIDNKVYTKKGTTVLLR
jgi:gliding motility-associated-like protein